MADRLTPPLAAPTSCVDFLGQLIGFPTVSRTSNDGINELVAARLGGLGFAVETTRFVDAKGVAKSNLVARRDPIRSPTAESPDTKSPDEASADEASPNVPGGVAYFCHTDVVPADRWDGPGGDPFRATSADGRIFGRGSCDMKGSLATMLQAVAEFPHVEQSRPIWVVCTADEEVGFQGAKHLVGHSAAYADLVGHQPLSIIGEPTSLAVYHAHKGITGFSLTSHGRAAHSSTRGGVNANVAMVPVLNQLWRIHERTLTDASLQDTRFDPPTLSWNFGVSDHMSVVNITPPRCDAWCCFRTMPGVDGQDLIDEVRRVAERHGVEMNLHSGCPPFWVDPEASFLQPLAELTGTKPETVCYGTDGGVFTGLRHRVILGPGDIAQAHTSDEWISQDQLARGITVFGKILRRWAG